jgi:uncharacterized protein YggE
MKMKSQIARLSTCVVFAVLAAGPVFADDGPSDQPTISVTGNAEIKVEPDQAVLAFSIENREPTLDESVAVNAGAIESVMQFLRAQGVEAKNIRTDVVRIRPIYKSATNTKQWQSRQMVPRPNVAIVDPNPLGNVKDELKPIGYEVRRGISVTIVDLAKLEKIYTGLLKNGVNEVSRVSFETTQMRKFRDQARIKAIRAAREKAAALAGELGAKLDGVLKISETNWSPSSSLMQNSISFAPRSGLNGAGMSRGTISVNATVSVVFILGNNKFD